MRPAAQLETRFADKQCRIRRVKCDETKPTCARCIQGRLNCVYESPTADLAAHQSLDCNMLPGNQPLVFVSPSQIKATDLEHRLFHYYLLEVADHMADTANRPLWAVHLPRAAKQQPAVWHACVSVAALHQRQWFATADVPDLALRERRRGELYTTSLRQYHKSLRSLIKIAPSASGSIDLEAQIAMLGANVLFITGAIQRGEMLECVTHLTNAFKLIHLWRFWEPVLNMSSPRRRSASIIPNMAMVLFYVQMDGLALESLPPALLWPWQWEHAVISSLQRPITSLLQALLEIEMIWIGIKDLFNAIPLRCSHTQRTFFANRRAVIRAYFQQWAARLDEFETSMSVASEMNGALLATLEVRRIVVGIMFRVDVHAFETCWDAFEPDFEEAVSLIASLEGDLSQTALKGRTVGRPGRKAPCSFTPSLTKSLYFLAKVCRSPVLRRRIIQLFVEHRQNERIVTEKQDSAYFVQSTLAVMKVEEGAWVVSDAQRPADCSCIVNSFICNSHRVFRYGIVYTAGNTAVVSLSTVDDIICGREPQTIPVSHMHTGNRE